MEAICAIAHFISYSVFPCGLWIWIEARLFGIRHALLHHASGRVW